MSTLKKLTLISMVALTTQTFAAEFSFDRPGLSFSTGITPVGRLAWEQSLPNVSYKQTTVNGQTLDITTFNADMMLRTGLANGLELRLGWDGPMWTRLKTAGHTREEHGLGDISIGLKKAIDLHDDQLSMALLAEAQLATGNDQFSNHHDVYTLGSSVSYQYNSIVNTAITMLYQHQDNHLAITAIPNIGYQFSDQWSGFSELIYRKYEGQDVEYALTSGVIYAPTQRTQFDASIGLDLNGMDKSYRAGLGVSYLF
ncbi:MULTISPECIES: transporter [unclassified Acinetobacter]|uniref:transporter n=1 Tax=unclassified Acinetobacter TaxID=196816 RepID=UPI002934EDB0|nr:MULTISPECIES: transporter [unclassified Acinetobacter]WOE30949.1 transporter [Acinetobacter sp. SAAs470]WOE39145.1 transporter [Acinetobacter sp. SAAs474]